MRREIVFYIEHTNKAFNKEKTKALLGYSISSILMPLALGTISDGAHVISHGAYVIIRDGSK